MNKKFIQQIPFFSHLSDEKLNIVLKKFEAIKFKKGEIVMHQGDKADGMYTIIFGEVEIVKDAQTIARLSDESFFGEMALIANEPRSATVRVISSDLSTFFLSTKSFKEIKNELDKETREEILKRISEDYS